MAVFLILYSFCRKSELKNLMNFYIFLPLIAMTLGGIFVSLTAAWKNQKSYEKERSPKFNIPRPKINLRKITLRTFSEKILQNAAEYQSEDLRINLMIEIEG